ncbi:MAG: glycoside hydrolase family 20 zincin-like fold domain-containing protein [Chitinophagaceae bacterium]
MRWITFNVIFLCTFFNCRAIDANYFENHFRLMPQPQKVELLAEKGITWSDVRNIRLVGEVEKPVMPPLLAGLPITKSTTQGTVSLMIDNKLKLPSNEGYILEIKAGFINITAISKEGLFYGLQTLQQLIEDARDQQIQIPSCRITDYPEIAYRAIHLDMKHHLESIRYYYEIIDRLAAIKINAVIVELEDKLRYRKASIVGAPNSISIEEFAALNKYAKDRFIEISPLVQGLGHASFILKHEAYKNLRDDSLSDWAFDPLNPDTYKLQFALYEDAIAATPYGRYLHVGGDEVGNLGKSELAKKSGMSPLELQMYWLKKVTEFAQQHNRIPIFWDDMVFKLSKLYETTYDKDIPVQEVNERWARNEHLLNENLNLFPKNCVYMRWNYDYPLIPGNQKAIEWYNKNHLQMMAATAAQQTWPMLPRSRSNFQAIKDFCKLTSGNNANGILCTIWDDASPHFETVWRGIYDFALFSWNYEDLNIENTHKLFRHRFYAPALATPENEFEDLLEDVLPFWETALLAEGDRDNYHKTFKLIDLPDEAKQGEWTANNKLRIEQALKMVDVYAKIKVKIKQAMETARRNQYSLEVMNQVNELQVYSARLILLLAEYDKATLDNKKSKIRLVKNYTDSFSIIRSVFETIYAKTRIMGNGEGYQLDDNVHAHLANGTNNTDWMFMYELPMNQKIDDWIKQQD